MTKKTATKKKKPTTLTTRKPGTGRTQKPASKAPKHRQRERDRLKKPAKKTAKKKKVGRPRVAKATLDLICIAVMEGASIPNACRAFGIAPQIVTKYRAIAAEQLENKLSSSPEIDFAIAMEEAEARRSNKLRARIFDHSRFDWRAAAWLLEGLEPEVWRKGANVSVTRSTQAPTIGEDGGGSIDPEEQENTSVVVNITVTDPIDLKNPPYK